MTINFSQSEIAEHNARYPKSYKCAACNEFMAILDPHVLYSRIDIHGDQIDGIYHPDCVIPLIVADKQTDLLANNAV